jgi:hypothetical protein
MREEHIARLTGVGAVVVGWLEDLTDSPDPAIIQTGQIVSRLTAARHSDRSRFEADHHPDEIWLSILARDVAVVAETMEGGDSETTEALLECFRKAGQLGAKVLEDFEAGDGVI